MISEVMLLLAHHEDQPDRDKDGVRPMRRWISSGLLRQVHCGLWLRVHTIPSLSCLCGKRNKGPKPTPHITIASLPLHRRLASTLHCKRSSLHPLALRLHTQPSSSSPIQSSTNARLPSVRPLLAASLAFVLSHTLYYIWLAFTLMNGERSRCCRTAGARSASAQPSKSRPSHDCLTTRSLSLSLSSAVLIFQGARSRHRQQTL